jgi:hypothetical protein
MSTLAPKSKYETRLPTALALYAAAEKLGYAVTEVSPEEMAKAKQASRDEDARLIASGEATPEEIQKKNNAFKERPIVLYWSPLAL